MYESREGDEWRSHESRRVEEAEKELAESKAEVVELRDEWVNCTFTTSMA